MVLGALDSPLAPNVSVHFIRKSLRIKLICEFKYKANHPYYVTIDLELTIDTRSTNNVFCLSFIFTSGSISVDLSTGYIHFP